LHGKRQEVRPLKSQKNSSMSWHVLPTWARRIASFTGIGIFTFLGDLALLFFLLEYTPLHYVLATACSFWVALSANYFLTRKYTFAGTERAVHTGYVIFMGTALVGVVFVILAMVVLVEYVGMAPLVARMCSAIIGAVWNYVINLKYNFKVEGKEY
jgi:putative flippase GtrA